MNFYKNNNIRLTNRLEYLIEMQQSRLTFGLAGSGCWKVVLMTMGVVTHNDSHWVGSNRVVMARVAKFLSSGRNPFGAGILFRSYCWKKYFMVKNCFGLTLVFSIYW